MYILLGWWGLIYRRNIGGTAAEDESIEVKIFRYKGTNLDETTAISINTSLR